MRETIKIAVLKRALGRNLYGVFCRARTVYLMTLVYAGLMTEKRLNEIAAKKHITMHEMISALDRMPHRYSYAESLRFVRIFKRYE